MSTNHLSPSLTPILDLEAPLPVPKVKWTTELTWRSWLVVLAIVVVIAPILFYAVQIPAVSKVADRLNTFANSHLESPDNIYTPAIIAILLLTMLFPVVAIHELGHLLFGRVVKFRFRSIIIAPFSLSKTSVGLKLNMHRKLPVVGFVHMELDRICRLRKRQLFFVLGGPAANLISGLLAYMLINSGAVSRNSWELRALGIFFGFSLFIGVVNLFSFETGGVPSDGAHLLMLTRSVPKSRRWLAVSGLDLLSERHIDPKHWNGRWASWATSIADDSAIALKGNWLAYVRASAREERESAAIHLERCLERINLAGEFFREVLILEAAVFMAWSRRDASKAVQWRGRLEEKVKLPELLHLRSQIALHCAQSDFDAALASWEVAFAAANASSPPMRPQSWLDWKKQIEDRRSELGSMVV